MKQQVLEAFLHFFFLWAFDKEKKAQHVGIHV
jgi:hypothetical protein